MKFPLLLKMLIASMCLSSIAYAQALWHEDSAVVNGGGDGEVCRYVAGNPAASNMAILSAGSDLSILFTTWGVQMAHISGTNGSLTFNASCNVLLDVTIPQGFYVTSLTQTVSGGLVKERGSVGGILSNVYLFEDKVPLNRLPVIQLQAQDQVVNALFSKTGTFSFPPGSKLTQCGRTAAAPFTTKFKYQLLAGAVRRPILDFSSRNVALPTFIFNVDSADFTLKLGPILAPCN